MQQEVRRRVAIVEDHALFAESLETVLVRHGYDVRRVDTGPRATPAGRVLGDVLRLRPRVVVLDLDLGDHRDGLRLVGPLSSAGIGVVVVTGTADPVRWGECLRQGARTVLHTGVPLSSMLASLRQVAEGRPAMSREQREHLVREYHRERLVCRDLRERLATLTPREVHVLGHLVAGRTVREIACSSVVAESTVRSQVRSLLAKLGVSSQIAAVGAAHRSGWCA